VGVKPVRFKGSGDYLKSFAQRARKDLDFGGLIAVFGILDFYGTPLTLPPNATVDAKYTWAKGELEHRAEHPRFRQHFAVHETQAWLLSDLSIFPAAIRNSLESYSNRPESVNFQQPPAKLLQQVYRANGREYKKVADGYLAFESWDALARVLTGKRMALLRYVRRHHVTSVRALAKALERDYSNVHADVQALTVAGRD
jgi:hypothetical protein